jgi:GNAT superfamily N-acetyltransferase
MVDHIFNVEKVLLTDLRMLDLIYALRVEAWRARAPDFPDMGVWTDTYDQVARHWAIAHGGKPIAAARMSIHARLADVPNGEIYDKILPSDLAGPIASINRLVVHPDWAGKGLPKRLDEARIAAARQASCACVLVETYSGTKRVELLEALGFKPLGLAGPYASGPLMTVKNGGGGRTYPLAQTPLALILDLLL